MPGCVWPEWKFVKQIGRGAYGTVYEAMRRDEFNVESRAAIKVISIPQDESELDTLRTEGLDLQASKTYMRKVVDAFVNEINLMITLKGSPNIVSVEDYKVVERKYEIGWDISIRMELLTPLYSYIADKTMSEKEVIKLGCDICSALEVCAKKNVIHRDIKPGNIFINDFGDFKLGDFGIARQMESLTTNLSRRGTGSYMAPEVEKGLKYNAKADLYSLGLVLYLLLNNNRMPFFDPNKQLLTPNDREQAIRRRLDGEPLPAPCNASNKMAEVILCACAYDPRRRFATPTAMKTALQNVLGRSVSSAGKTAQRTAAAAAAAGTAAAGTAAAGAAKTAAKTASAGAVKTAEGAARAETAKTAAGTAKTATGAAAAQKTSAPSPTQPTNAKTQSTKKRRTGILIAVVVVAAAVCVVFGVRAVQGMRNDKYNSLVQQQIDYIASGNYAMEEEAYEQASGMISSNLESYYEHARALHVKPTVEGEPDYEACIDFIEDEIFDNKRINQTQSDMADVWYLYADSLFQEGDYPDAVNAYRELFNIGTNVPLYYQDYAIALAYDGQSANAESVLETAESRGLGTDGVYYTKGEVEKANAEYEAALNDFNYSITLSDDDELIARAYLAIADIYRTQGNLETERSILQEAENYNSTKLPQILQNLIQVDIDLADASAGSANASTYRQEAISLLKLVEDNGWETFQTYNNLVYLYQQEGNLTEAENILLSIQSAYGSDYRWYKRYAFLEIAKQELLSNSKRNYSSFAQYYNEANSLYNTYINNGGTTDNEMGVLTTQYEDVKSGGWLR